jgi:acyl-CoA synthetase (AMP-forming)/AMP-acid ligase II
MEIAAIPFASWSTAAGVLRLRSPRRLDTVAIIASNIPEMIETHFAVPMLGAVLNPINTRLDAATIAFSLNHGDAKVFIVDGEYARLAKEALRDVEHPILVIDIDMPGQRAAPIGAVGYEALLAEGDPAFSTNEPQDEWQSLCLLYTSGTTGDPKGAAYYTAIAEHTSRRWATHLPSGSVPTACICGPCRCSTAAGGLFHGPRLRLAQRKFAYGR